MYGSSSVGNRSVVIPKKLMTPSTRTMMTATTTVYGFLTQYEDMKVFPFF